jgi:hypothetical protein
MTACLQIYRAVTVGVEEVKESVSERTLLRRR